MLSGKMQPDLNKILCVFVEKEDTFIAIRYRPYQFEHGVCKATLAFFHHGIVVNLPSSSESVNHACEATETLAVSVANRSAWQPGVSLARQLAATSHCARTKLQALVTQTLSFCSPVAAARNPLKSIEMSEMCEKSEMSPLSTLSARKYFAHVAAMPGNNARPLSTSDWPENAASLPSPTKD